MEFIHSILKASPEIALFLSLALGYSIGKIQFGRFQLGGVAGSLLVAVIVSQLGVTIDNGVKNVMFVLFIYAVGFDSGPQFFGALNKSALREIAMAVFLFVMALLTTLACARIYHLDKGLAAGIAGGGVTQSAIIGTADDAISRLNLPPDQIAQLQSNVAIGYAVTYVFGSLGAILICANLLPRFMKTTLKADALKAEAALGKGAQESGGVAALTPLVGRLFHVQQASGKTVKDVESTVSDDATIERVSRGGKSLDPTPDMRLESGDLVLVVGRRIAMVDLAASIGPETGDAASLPVAVQTRQAVFTRKNFDNQSIEQIRSAVDRTVKHGVYIQAASRMGNALVVAPQTKLQHGDVITFYGTPTDTARAVKEAGYELVPSDKTDFVYLGTGIVVGLLIGLLGVRIGGVSLTLGSGGGALLAGLLFGWLRSKHPMYGAMPAAASQLLKDFGLAAFVTVVGLNSGLSAMQTLEKSGVKLFLLGAVITIVPLILTMLFGRYVLRYDNAAIFAGALSGSRSANPAFGEILDLADSSVPTVPFAITYAIANVLLTLLGPLIVGLV